MGDDPAFLMIGTPPVNGLGPCELGGHGWFRSDGEGGP